MFRAQHCELCALYVALVDDVERGNHRVGAFVVAFTLLVGSSACHWKSIVNVCSHIEGPGKWWLWRVVSS